MKNLLFAVSMLLLSVSALAQVGIGTTSPNSTLDVRGSIALAYRSFTGNSSAATTDNTLVFTGTSNATLTLPDASTITGRSYWIKNGSSNSSVLTIATTSSQTIDGNATWVLNTQNKAVNVVSNGTSWAVSSESTPGSGAGSSWIYGGNSVPSIQSLGTSNNFALPFITNNTEKMRISPTGNVGIGTSSFNGSNPEKFLVDAGTTSSFNVISGKGTIDNYLQLNIQNNSSGNSASSDVVATANNGNENINYIDMGINSSTYNNTSIPILTGANNAYLYTTGNDFILGNASNGRYMSFFTGGTATTNERMRITGNGLVGIGTSTFNSTNPEKLLVDAGSTSSYNVISGKGTINSYLQLNIQNNSAGGNASSDLVATANNGTESVNFVNLGINGGGNSSSGQLGGANTAYLYATGNDFVMGNATNDAELRFFTTTGSTYRERMRIDGTTGSVGIGTTSFNGAAPEKLLVDAGTTSSYNVISGKGSINNYLQLNIQNLSSGSAASSDVVATANDGNESQYFVDMGINSSGYSSTGILGGARTAYVYATGTDFVIGNGTASRDLVFFTGGTATADEKMRITSAAVQAGVDNSITLGSVSRRWSAVYAVNGTIQTSDIRFKKNILPLNYGLAEIMKLEPVSYDWKDNSGSHKIGLIAQEVKKIVPEVVTGDESKESLGMNYAELVPVLINAVKELKSDLENTKKELEELKKSINRK